MTYYYYCPNCGFEQEGLKRSDIPRDACGNIRDGYGTPIYHYKCPSCGNLDAGAMQYIEHDDEERWKSYCRIVIGSYQGVRGFASKQRGKGRCHE